RSVDIRRWPIAGRAGRRDHLPWSVDIDCDPERNSARCGFRPERTERAHGCGDGALRSAGNRLKASPVAMIAGIGAAVPAGIMTNADFERTLDTSDQWIV